MDLEPVGRQSDQPDLVDGEAVRRRSPALHQLGGDRLREPQHPPDFCMPPWEDRPFGRPRQAGR
jgi:hypothetical protein